jgi:O-antigen/teichoic acid export membrane protein
MKAFALPSFSAGLAAITSLIYYSLFARQFGDVLLGNFIFIISLVSLVQIALIPQAWVYIIGAPSSSVIRYRFSIGVAVELFGGLLAALILIVLCLIPATSLRNHATEVAVVFMGLWIAGCSSPQGLARRLELWNIFLCWTLLSNVIRLIFMLVYDFIFVPFGPLNADTDKWQIFFLFYLLPEVIRLLLVYPYLLRKFYIPVSFKRVFLEARMILNNWLFDVGSAITEVADKVVVGYLLGPTFLVVYFFARKISILCVMILEPYFAESYRRIVTSVRVNLRQAASRIYFCGMSISLGILAIIILTLFLNSETVFLRRFVPAAIYHHLYVFVSVLAIDCFIAANRWGRFLTQLTRKHVHLFAVRLISFGIFIAACAYLVPRISSVAIPIAFFFCWIFETLFNIDLLNKVDLVYKTESVKVPYSIRAERDTR